mgnify:CR=1 FL=1
MVIDADSLAMSSGTEAEFSTEEIEVVTATAEPRDEAGDEADDAEHDERGDEVAPDEVDPTDDDAAEGADDAEVAP